MIHNIVVIEDDKSLSEFLKNLLLDTGYSVKVFGEGVAALKYIRKVRPDLILLDLGLPIIGGETICSESKKIYPDLPIIILTARGTISDVVKGLNLGADDYIPKPFESEELLARIKARLRDRGDSSKIIMDNLELDTKTMEVTRGKRQIKLTPQEFKLLEYLMRNKGRVLTRDMILNRIWLYSADIDTRVVDVYIGYLRKKIDAQEKKKLIRSVRGFGYIMKE